MRQIGSLCPSAKGRGGRFGKRAWPDPQAAVPVRSCNGFGFSGQGRWVIAVPAVCPLAGEVLFGFICKSDIAF
jgi:hypothetical protein